MTTSMHLALNKSTIIITKKDNNNIYMCVRPLQNK